MQILFAASVSKIRRMVSSDFFVLNVNLKGENKMGNLIPGEKPALADSYVAK